MENKEGLRTRIKRIRDTYAPVRSYEDFAQRADRLGVHDVVIKPSREPYIIGSGSGYGGSNGGLFFETHDTNVYLHTLGKIPSSKRELKYREFQDRHPNVEFSDDQGEQRQKMREIFTAYERATIIQEIAPRVTVNVLSNDGKLAEEQLVFDAKSIGMKPYPRSRR